jgi:Ca2+-binding EF-hand superfamily protein
MNWCAEQADQRLAALKQVMNRRIPIEEGTLMAARHIALVTLFTAMAAATAVAQQAETDADSAGHYFDRLDQKKQGFITLADMQRIEAKAFRRTDDNKDGELTLSEYNFGIPDDRQDVIDRFTRRFRLADADNNGRVTMDEYMAFCARVIDAADANKDGQVTKEEFVAAAGGGAAE